MVVVEVFVHGVEPVFTLRIWHVPEEVPTDALLGKFQCAGLFQVVVDVCGCVVADHRGQLVEVSGSHFHGITYWVSI